MSVSSSPNCEMVHTLKSKQRKNSRLESLRSDCFQSVLIISLWQHVITIFLITKYWNCNSLFFVWMFELIRFKNREVWSFFKFFRLVLNYF
jgi:hypothetical protein